MENTHSEYFMIHKRKSCSVILSIMLMGFIVLFFLGLNQEIKVENYTQNGFDSLKLIPWFIFGYFLFLGLSMSIILFFKIPKRIEEDGLLKKGVKTLYWGFLIGLGVGTIFGIIFVIFENRSSEMAPMISTSIGIIVSVSLPISFVLGIISGLVKEFKK